MGSSQAHGRADVGGGNGDWRLSTNSPCVDVGSFAHTTAFDQSRVPRPLDGNNDGVVAPDLGAFETLHPQADSDRDRMPDTWELANALNPVADAAADSDRDMLGRPMLLPWPDTESILRAQT